METYFMTKNSDNSSKKFKIITFNKEMKGSILSTNVHFKLY